MNLNSSQVLHFSSLVVMRKYIDVLYFWIVEAGVEYRSMGRKVVNVIVFSSVYFIQTYFWVTIPGWPKNNGTVDFLGLCSDQQLSFFTLLDRTSFLHYNNTKIIKFGWKLFILWVISYGLSFSGFAIKFSLVGGPPKNGTVNSLGLCSDEQLFFSPCWIEHLFFL